MQVFQDKINVTNIRSQVNEALKDKKAISFSSIKSFPKERGVYIAYEDSEVVYVGSAYSDKRTIYVRCSQYLGKKDSGATLRKKVQKINGLTAIQAVSYIQQKFIAKFILMNNQSEKEIKTLEHLLIGVYNPKYND